MTVGKNELMGIADNQIHTLGSLTRWVSEGIMEDYGHLLMVSKKLHEFFHVNGEVHHPYCNYPRPEGNGKGKCNCGMADLHNLLKDYEYHEDNMG